MKNFVGIDLGTTNSAICSYDGSATQIWKSPEQNDVTPSAIYIDRRGNKYVGKRAYDSAPHSPDNSAMLFKRLMGTKTPIHISAVNLTKTPEECSSEVLRVLFGYLPEEIRNDSDTGTVITVPAAFNQMQKEATMQAASMAGLGKVALMQEPVAAVMSVMRTRNTDGMFLIYDLGGGTLDVAIAESIGGRVNLLAHGGIAMCGGRDFDRTLVDNVVRPWLLDNFDLPEDFSVNPDFKSLFV
jgi:molecular chaperone DnaK